MQIFKFTLLLLLLGTVTPSMMTAQTNTTLVIALPDWWEGQFDEAIFDEFEANHVGVNVAINFVSSDDAYFSPPYVNLDEHINKSLTYATMGDVLYTGSYQLSVEGTRAGTYLDLTPLIATDTELDNQDFYPALWQSFQWDGGMWAIPFGGSLTFNIYDKNAFDEVNVPYPNRNWTIHDYATYTRALTFYKESGAVDVPGMDTYYLQPLFYSLLNRGIYDMSIVPETANLVNADIIELLIVWTDLAADNIVNPFNRVDYDSEDVPLHVEESWRVTNQYLSEASDWQATLLSNGWAGLRAEGFSISSGTDYPELAYELIMYLTQQPDLVDFYFLDVLARQSMAGIENENATTVFGEKPPELRVLLDEAILSAIPVGELRYYGYLENAIQLVLSDGKSVEDALIESQRQLDANLARAREIGAETTVIVQSPAVTPALGENEIALNFGMNTLVSPLPNRDQWDQVAQEFADSDLEVGQIDLSFDLGATEDDDCFYRQYNNLRSLSIEEILPLDPFLTADANFNRDDIIPQALTQLTKDNQIWGVPLNVTPSIMWINEDMFNRAGIPLPDTQWTMNDFVDALNQLDTITDDPPFDPRSYGGNYMLNFIVAFGGLPIATNQPNAMPDLTSEQNINAIRQALDLAKAGLIDYDEMSGFTGGGGGFITDDAVIYDATLSSLDFRFQQRRDGVSDNYRAVLFPSGTQYAPLTFEVGGGYINASTPYVDACYRWISYLANHPELFDGMPVRRSQLASTQSQGDDIFALYSAIDSQIDHPDTIVFPFAIASPSAFHYQQWVFRAFDDYVLDDMPLEDALAQSQHLINDYATCIEPIEPIDTGGLSREEMNDYVGQFSQCATTVDSVFATFYSS